MTDPNWDSLLSQVDHRAWPPPVRRWTMTMSWHDLLFAHWPLEPEKLEPLLPQGLTLDVYEGRAWISVVPFRMTHVGPRGFAHLPLVSSFPELNVRTYVTARDKPGVWFLSLDAASALACASARMAFHLPYYWARMKTTRDPDGVNYLSERRLGGPATFVARYRRLGAAFQPAPASFEHWLTERYCLYSHAPGVGLQRGEIHHPPWVLHRAEVEIAQNSMASAAGVQLPNVSPICHFVDRQDVVAWTLDTL